MATNVFSGRSLRLQTAATSSGSLVNLGALEGADLEITRTKISVVHQETSGWEQQLAGIASWTLTARAFYLSTSASVNEQDSLRTSLTAGTRRWFSFTPSTGSGGNVHRGYGFVNMGRISGDQNSAVTHNFTIEGDGPITES